MATPKHINKVKTGANAITFVAVTILAILFLNLIGNRYFGRIDLTSDHVYTLSPASRDAVAHLPDRLTVKAFISGDLAPPFSQVGQFTRDMLAEYASASKGKLHWTVVDPGSDPELAKEAEKLKVPKRRRGSVSSSDKVEINSSYLGVAFEYQGQVESIPEINSPEGLEFQMTSIIRLLTLKKKKVAFATSEGELPFNEDQHGGERGMQMIKLNLRAYDTVPVTLNVGEQPIPDDVDVLVIAGPKQPFSDRAKYVIDQFLMRGKSVAFFVDGMIMEQPRGMGLPGQEQPHVGRKNDVGLDELLAAYGVHVDDDLVLEPRQNMVGPLPMGGQLFLANYPTFVTATDLDKKSPITDKLPGVVLPFASSVQPDQAAQKNLPGVEFTALARSTKDAWKQSGFFLFDPAAQSMKIGTDRGPFAFGYSVKGKLKSFYAGKPYVNAKGEKVTSTPNVSAPPGLDHPLDESQGPARLVVMGSSNMLSDEYLRIARQVSAYQNDVLFFMSAVDWLAGDDAMTAVRAKGVTARPLTIGSDATPALVKYGNVVGVPLLFILFGVLRWRLRTARRRAARV